MMAATDMPKYYEGSSSGEPCIYDAMRCLSGRVCPRTRRAPLSLSADSSVVHIPPRDIPLQPWQFNAIDYALAWHRLYPLSDAQLDQLCWHPNPSRSQSWHNAECLVSWCKPVISQLIASRLTAMLSPNEAAGEERGGASGYSRLIAYTDDIALDPSKLECILENAMFHCRLQWTLWCLARDANVDVLDAFQQASRIRLRRTLAEMIDDDGISAVATNATQRQQQPDDALLSKLRHADDAILTGLHATGSIGFLNITQLLTTGDDEGS